MNTEQLKTDQTEFIEAALVTQRLYNPYDVFTHPPEFYSSDDDRYTHKIHIVRWNTRSTRMSVYYSRFDSKKNKWIFRRESGLKRQRHGEKMR